MGFVCMGESEYSLYGGEEQTDLVMGVPVARFSFISGVSF